MIIQSRPMYMVCCGHLIQIEWLNNICSIQLLLTRARVKGKNIPSLSPFQMIVAKLINMWSSFVQKSVILVDIMIMLKRGQSWKKAKFTRMLWMWYLWHLVEVQIDYVNSFKHLYLILRWRWQQIIGVFLYSLTVADVHERACLRSSIDARYELIYPSPVSVPLLPVVSLLFSSNKHPPVQHVAHFWPRLRPQYSLTLQEYCRGL